MDNPRTYPARRSPRLRGYDYAQPGAYFVTICCHQRASLFGEIAGGVMSLSEAGIIASECWLSTPEHFPGVELDLWVIMPNHMHGILLIQDPGGARSDHPTLGNVVNNYKGTVTRQTRRRCNDPHLIVWQSRYHDHIIRNEQDLNRIRDYVLANPARWSEDTFYTGQP